MNRSFRAQESSRLLDSAARQRQQLRASMMAEKDEELSLFLEMRRREKEQDSLLLNNNPDEFESPLGSKPGTSPVFNISSGAAPARKTGPPDDFLNSEGDKNDYEWLLTPPGTPLFPSLEMESHRTMMNQNGDSKGRPAALTSRLANSSSEPAARNHLTSRQPPTSSSNGTTRRPSSSGGPGSRPASAGGPGSRPATPTGRSSTLTTTNSKSSSRPSTPTSRTTTVSSTTRPSLTNSRSTKPTPPMSRSTSSSRLTPSASKPTTRPAGSTTRSTTSTATTRSAGPSRSTTPLSRSTARSSTPTSSRPTLPPPKTISRSSTPTRRPPSAATTTTSKPSQIKPSSPAAKPTPSKTTPAAASRAPSPTVRSRPWKPSDMPGFSLETPPNLRTTLPERPLSATRGRPGAPSPRSNSVEPAGGGRARRQSCSPSRGRAPMHASGSSVPAVNRGYSKANDNVSPVLMGAKMVERVINMRKLAPPRSDEKGSPHGNLSAKSSSPDSAGFGRTLSKKSLDMAIRHMDIRRTIPGNLRPLMTNIPASSMYSVRSGHTRGRPMNVSDSPLATSSNASSEISVYNNNGVCLEAASEKEDDAGSERGCRSPPASLQGR
ncbi:endochitinase A-like [Brassica napus]|nr:PREDICTED: endochitinase A-like [Brassica oleracea var. oleracea]XP_013697343.1 endochitinase A-like [Brassica napus]